MKNRTSCKGIIFFIVSALILNTADCVCGENLREIGRNEDGVLYYNSDSVRILEGNIVSVWVTQVYSQAQSEKIRRSLSAYVIYRKPFSKASLTEVNCRERSYQTKKYIIYDEWENVLYLHNNKEDVIKLEIIPGSVMDRMRVVLCR